MKDDDDDDERKSHQLSAIERTVIVSIGLHDLRGLFQP